MAQPNSKPKQSMQRGAKLLLASLSVATTLSGWAWLTRSELLDANPSEPIQADEAVTQYVDIPPQALNGTSSVMLAALPTRALPNLAKLPVRGLRQVGDATAVPPEVAQTQGQPQAPRDRNGGGGQNANAPQNNPSASEPKQPAPQKPEPPPKPKRKTKSSK